MSTDIHQELSDLRAELAQLRAELRDLGGKREIDVERINVVEPDGTPALTISSVTRFPQELLGVFPEPYPHPRRMAGMLFYTEEGAECGGLVWTGTTAPDGSFEQTGGLTFDRYRQDQIVQLVGASTPEGCVAGLRISDVPATSMPDYASKLRELNVDLGSPEAGQILQEPGEIFAPRAFLGRMLNGDAALELRDANGTVRLTLAVAADGGVTATVIGTDGKERSLLPGPASPEG